MLDWGIRIEQHILGSCLGWRGDTDRALLRICEKSGHVLAGRQFVSRILQMWQQPTYGTELENQLSASRWKAIRDSLEPVTKTLPAKLK